ncbi:hypothetical protein [Bartonella massiliensis]|uniref:hypothetical protein n=1 Tax=Bartonella massiliensis TaxID=929795 RepID=UPI00115BF9C1|nr:hypothetical protein [Bartonella massiliensis]
MPITRGIAAAAFGIKDCLHSYVSDACSLPFNTATFTHVLGGCNFAFIQQREQALSEVNWGLKADDIICTSNFYYRKTPSDRMIDVVHRLVGFRSAPLLQYWRDFFANAGLDHKKNHE